MKDTDADVVGAQSCTYLILCIMQYMVMYLVISTGQAFRSYRAVVPEVDNGVHTTSSVDHRNIVSTLQPHRFNVLPS